MFLCWWWWRRWIWWRLSQEIAGSYSGNNALRSSWSIGQDGSIGQGGNGSTTFHNGTGGGGGGGGGYYGGGSGGIGSIQLQEVAVAVDHLILEVTNFVNVNPGINNGNGYVIFT